MAVSITSITPDKGSIEGGTFCKIVGTGFGATQGSSKVYLDSIEVDQYVLWSDTLIWVIVSAFTMTIRSGQTPTAVDVKVDRGGGDDDTLVDGFDVYQKICVRERILAFIKDLLEHIVGIDYARPDDANTGSYPDLEIETGGDVNLATGVYDSNEEYEYTIEVTTGGASGTAEVSITDNPADLIVTSDYGLPLGDSGAFIKFTFSGNLTLGDKWYVRVGPYHNTIKKAIRWSLTGMDIEEYPSVYMHEPTETTSQIPNPLSSQSMNLMLEVWDREFEDISKECSLLYQDVVSKIQKNYGLSCLVVNTAVAGSESFTGPEGQGLCGIAINLIISYRWMYEDPTTPVGQA